jgi:thioredoxin-related protein
MRKTYGNTSRKKKGNYQPINSTIEDDETIKFFQNNKIKVYSSPSCFYCMLLKKTLKDTKVDSLVSINEDVHRFPAIVKEKGVPYILNKSNGKYYLGNPPTIEELISSLQ